MDYGRENSHKNLIGRGWMTSGQYWYQHIRQMNQQDISDEMGNVQAYKENKKISKDLEEIRKNRFITKSTYLRRYFWASFCAFRNRCWSYHDGGAFSGFRLAVTPGTWVPRVDSSSHRASSFSLSTIRVCDCSFEKQVSNKTPNNWLNSLPLQSWPQEPPRPCVVLHTLVKLNSTELVSPFLPPSLPEFSLEPYFRYKVFLFFLSLSSPFSRILFVLRNHELQSQTRFTLIVSKKKRESVCWIYILIRDLYNLQHL